MENKRTTPPEGLYQLILKRGTPPVLVHGYHCEDRDGEFVLGFNAHDGGGLFPFRELMDEAVLTPVTLVTAPRETGYEYENSSVEQQRRLNDLRSLITAIQNEDQQVIKGEAPVGGMGTQSYTTFLGPLCCDFEYTILAGKPVAGTLIVEFMATDPLDKSKATELNLWATDDLEPELIEATETLYAELEGKPSPHAVPEGFELTETMELKETCDRQVCRRAALRMLVHQLEKEQLPVFCWTEYQDKGNQSYHITVGPICSVFEYKGDKDGPTQGKLAVNFYMPHTGPESSIELDLWFTKDSDPELKEVARVVYDLLRAQGRRVNDDEAAAIADIDWEAGENE